MSRSAASAWLAPAGCLAGALAAWLAAAPVRAVAQGGVAPAVQQSSQPHDASLDDYRTHLQALTALVDACAKARDLKTCDPAQVGADDRVPLTPAAPNPAFEWTIAVLALSDILAGFGTPQILRWMALRTPRAAS